jgi:outer membrane murein-binding lipoprotein Lpp
MQALRLTVEALKDETRTTVKALAEEVRRLGNAIDDMRAEQVEAMHEGASQALARLAHDSDRGRPYWQAGADHMGRRWTDNLKLKAGGWLFVGIGVAVGALAVAVLFWYLNATRLPISGVKP